MRTIPHRNLFLWGVGLVVAAFLFGAGSAIGSAATAPRAAVAQEHTSRHLGPGFKRPGGAYPWRGPRGGFPGRIEPPASPRPVPTPSAST